MDGPYPQLVPTAAAESPVSVAMPRRILVGVDEGPGSADALALAGALAEAAGAELIVASVRPFWPESIPPGDYGRVISEEEDELRREVAPLLRGRQFRTRVIAGGRAGDGLHEIAVTEQADLIVIASTHRGPIGRVLPGSVGERVLDGAPCAVAIAPRGYGADRSDGRSKLRRIVVGYDGSRESVAALADAVAIAADLDATIVLVGVVEMRFDLAGFPRPANVDEIARIERTLARGRASLSPDIAVETAEVHGIASEVITALARDADLLAIGSRGSYGPVRRIFLGSVAAKVARMAPCPTVIVPAG